MISPSPSSGDTSIVANLQSMSVAGCHLFLGEDEEFYPRQCSANLPVAGENIGDLFPEGIPLGSNEI